MLQKMDSCVDCVKLASIYPLTPKFFLEMEFANFSTLYPCSKNILHVTLSSHIHKKRILFNTLLNFKYNCLNR